MKKLLKYSIIVIALITGVMAINIYNSQNPEIKKNFTQENSHHQSSDYYFNSFQIDTPDNCKNNEEIRIIHNLQTSSARVLIYTFSHSVNQSSRLTNTKFYSSRILFLVFLSNNHNNGSYLYSLRKLLI